MFGSHLGHMFQITDNMLRYRKSKPPQTSKEINSNNKLGGGISSNSLLSNNDDDVNDESDAIFYHVITSPAFGKLQYRYEGFFDEISSHSNSYLNSFTQKDIDEGSLTRLALLLDKKILI